MADRTHSAGFTLLEVGIVLVIIGLIVGGVLVGGDLIKASQIRATVTQMEKFNAAASTFRGKYRGYPGDLQHNKAVEYGYNTALTDPSRDGTPGKGDGNDKIEGCALNSTVLGCETLLFWVDLDKAGLFVNKTDMTSLTATTQISKTNLDLQKILPSTRVRENALYTIFTNGSRNFYAIGGVSTDATGAIELAPALTPLESRGIDEKMDDGRPLTGLVSALVTNLTTPAVAAATGPCVATDGSYISSTDGYLNSIGCSIRIYTAF